MTPSPRPWRGLGRCVCKAQVCWAVPQPCDDAQNLNPDPLFNEHIVVPIPVTALDDGLVVGTDPPSARLLSLTGLGMQPRHCAFGRTERGAVTLHCFPGECVSLSDRVRCLPSRA
jgi:hypothetical protein